MEDSMTNINNVDTTITIGIVYSEIKLLKTMYDSPWSVELNQRIQHVSYWRLIKSQLKTKISQH